MTTTNSNHIILIGEHEDNFFKLGQQDKAAYLELSQHISRICTKNTNIAKAVKYASEMALNFSKKDTLLKAELNAYAKGLEVPVEKVMLNMFLPELVSSFNKWTPDILSFMPGCSSAFIWDNENACTLHTRILDYPLGSAFDNNSRTISYKLNAEYNIYSHSVVGIPFPGLTSMNEKGLTLALHYKHSDYLNLNGQSIFMICYQILRYCSKVSEIKKFLRSYQSMTSWGIYISDSEGEVCSIDIKGDEVSLERFDLKQAKQLYFNNRKNLQHNKSLPPFGNYNQCMMRKNSAKEKMAKIDNSKDLLISSLESLCSIDEKKQTHALDWKLSPITPASIQAVSLRASTSEAAWIGGPSPKQITDKIQIHKNIFEQIQNSSIETKNENSENFINAQKAISTFQIKLDQGNIEDAYHYIQTAIDLFKPNPEKFIYSFYFLALQYIYEKEKKDLNFIYKDLLKLRNKLPAYLEDHRLLFLLRLEIRLDLPITDNTTSFSNIDLLDLYEREKKLGPTKLDLLKRLIFPRVEILDILYVY